MSSQMFGGGIIKATLSLVQSDGTKVDLEFSAVRSLTVNTGLSDYHIDHCASNPWLREFGRPAETRLELSGVIKTTTVTDAKKEKPVPKPKAPTVKTSSLRLRKADKAATVASKKLTVLEAALRVARGAKEAADTERKLATEALLASAIA